MARVGTNLDTDAARAARATTGRSPRARWRPVTHAPVGKPHVHCEPEAEREPESHRALRPYESAWRQSAGRARLSRASWPSAEGPGRGPDPYVRATRAGRAREGPVSATASAADQSAGPAWPSNAVRAECRLRRNKTAVAARKHALCLAIVGVPKSNSQSHGPGPGQSVPKRRAAGCAEIDDANVTPRAL